MADAGAAVSFRPDVFRETTVENVPLLKKKRGEV
jgi:hypothetical protein